VFERFFRAQTRGRKHDGSGLGLYIARGIVIAHGGRIWLDSKSARGTTVFFSLPSSR
jgi:two-component system sensor histidine kinase VicK